MSFIPMAFLFLKQTKKSVWQKLTFAENQVYLEIFIPFSFSRFP